MFCLISGCLFDTSLCSTTSHLQHSYNKVISSPSAHLNSLISSSSWPVFQAHGWDLQVRHPSTSSVAELLAMSGKAFLYLPKLFSSQSWVLLHNVLLGCETSFLLPHQTCACWPTGIIPAPHCFHILYKMLLLFLLLHLWSLAARFIILSWFQAWTVFSFCGCTALSTAGFRSLVKPFQHHDGTN